MRLVKRVVPDGILDGCAITKTGAVLHVASGHIVACGALVEVDATDITVSASGELVLHIDLTAEEPAQLIVRSTATLVKQNLTTGGNVYEFKMASFTFNSGAITQLSVNGGSSSSSSLSSGTSGSSTKSGTVVDKIGNTTNRPFVYYSCSYASTKSGTTLQVTLNYSAWLGSSSSTLGTGIKLTVYTRVNGGTWQSTVIKENSASWSGTSRHTASMNITGTSESSTATIEFYVTRTGSSYSGTAGTIGSSSNPKRYTISV